MLSYLASMGEAQTGLTNVTEVATNVSDTQSQARETLEGVISDIPCDPAAVRPLTLLKLHTISLH